MAPLTKRHRVVRFMRTDFEYASLSLSPTPGTSAQHMSSTDTDTDTDTDTFTPVKGGESKRMHPLGTKEILLSLQEIDPNSNRAAESLSSTTSSKLETTSKQGKNKRHRTNTKTSKWHTFNSEDFKQFPVVASKTMPSHVTGKTSDEAWVRFEEIEKSANHPKHAFVESTPLRKSRKRSLLDGTGTPSKVSSNTHKRAFVETTPLRKSRKRSLLDATPSKVSLASIWARSNSPDPSNNQC